MILQVGEPDVLLGTNVSHNTAAWMAPVVLD